MPSSPASSYCSRSGARLTSNWTASPDRSISRGKSRPWCDVGVSRRWARRSSRLGGRRVGWWRRRIQARSEARKGSSPTSKRVGSASEGRTDDGEDLGPLEEKSALPTRSHARCTVRPLQVHVSAARARRVQVGAGIDSRLRHLRRVHCSPQDRRLSLRSEVLRRAFSPPGRGEGSCLELVVGDTADRFQVRTRNPSS